MPFKSSLNSLILMWSFVLKKNKGIIQEIIDGCPKPNFLFIQSPFTFTFIYIVDISTV